MVLACESSHVSSMLSAADLHVSAQLYMHGTPCAPRVRTFCTPGSRLRWDEWLTFTTKFSDLSADAFIMLHVVRSTGPRRAFIIGSAKLPLFHGQVLREGVLKIRLQLNPTTGGKFAYTFPPSGKISCVDFGGVGGGYVRDLEREMEQLERLSELPLATLARGAVEIGWLNRPSLDALAG